MSKYTTPMFVLLGTSILSCSDVDTESVHTIEQPIIFNDFNVEQQRGQLYQAKDLKRHSEEQQIKYRTGTEMRAAGRMTVSKFVFNPNTSSCNETITSSSGTLVSDSRLMASHHGLFNTKHDTPINIRFEGSFFNAHPSRDYETSIDDEVPFLAKRLFSLGLDTWAETTSDHAQDARSSLKDGWRGFIDEEGIKQEFVKPLDPTKPTVLTGDDVFFLKVKNDTLPKRLKGFGPIETVTRVPTGRFDLTKPAVFFERTDVKQLQEAGLKKCTIDSNAPLHAYHTNSWPDENSIQNGAPALPLVSNPGYRSNDASTECNAKWKDNTVCYYNGNDVIQGSVHYLNCIRTTLDARPSSSGGGVLAHQVCRECEGTCPDDGYTKNIQPTNLYVKGLIQGGTQQYVGWLTDVTKPVDSEFIKLSKESGRSTLDPELSTKVTAVSSEMERWATRDIDYSTNADPFKPQPDQPVHPGPEIEVLPVCAEAGHLDHGYDCSIPKIRKAQNGVYEYTPPEPTGGGNGLPTKSADPLLETENTAPPENGTRTDYVFCNYSFPKTKPNPLDLPGIRLPYGMMIGMLGSPNSSTLPLDGKTIVQPADFMGICIPWSSAPWINNWNYTYVQGLHQKVSEQATALLPPSLTKLYKILRAYYEVRSIDNSDPKNHERLHPISFKTCPPNYYMEGITFSVGEEKGRVLPGTTTPDSTPKILGVSKLHCARIPARYEAIVKQDSTWKDGEFAYMKKTYEVKLVADSDKYEYTLANEPFTLDARIGSPVVQPSTPKWTNIKEVPFMCEPTLVDRNLYPTTIVGLEYRVHSDNLIDNLFLLCGLAPGILKEPTTTTP